MDDQRLVYKEIVNDLAENEPVIPQQKYIIQMPVFIYSEKLFKKFVERTISTAVQKNVVDQAGVPSRILNSRDTLADQFDVKEQRTMLPVLFIHNFKLSQALTASQTTAGGSKVISCSQSLTTTIHDNLR